MIIRIILASIVSAIVLFFWGFLYWGVIATSVSPWHAISAESDSSVIATMKQAFPVSGVYMYPWLDASAANDPEASEKFMQQHEEGPIVQVFYRASGVSQAEMRKVMGFGFAHMLASAALGSILLASAEPLCCYGARVFFVFGLGLFATVWINGADLIWWHYPGSHMVFIGAYNVAAWLLAGLVIAAIVKKPQAAANQV